MAIAIKAENISKQYRLGYVGSGSLKDDARRWWARMRGKEDPLLTVGETNDRSTKGESDYVWALKDINFEIEQGDTVGIIGRNGAGKSTLLKLLSKVTAPTTGNIKVKGRIASLLEVGTGFHGELTGRENIYLNGAIMGMRKHEITRKLDEIVDFAGVERYLDTPVKRYSSGMYVRLGFAVAAHLENEILIVDEVLAVGDAEFQKKCLGKLGDVSKGEGRTVFFVSHNAPAITKICTSAILLESGIIKSLSSPQEILNQYNNSDLLTDWFFQNTVKSGPYILDAKVIASLSDGIHEFGEDLLISIRVYTPEPIQSAALSYQIVNSKGIEVVHVLNLKEEISFCEQPGIYKLESKIIKCKLYPDKYTLIVHFSDRISRKKYETIKNICGFEVCYLGDPRDYYWAPGVAVYVEDNIWSVTKDI